ncbi:MAG: HAD family phosphatase [Lachnospiraceae bacterium]|nr:HAD family phosphatase [Lachnospiraceae bacterium]
MNKKMLVLDIDGTLTNSKKEITPATKEAIFKIMDKGHIVVIASGRPTPGTAKVANELELDKRGGYVLAFNGCRITNWKTKEVIYQNVLDNSLIPMLCKFADEKQIGLISYEKDCVITSSPHDEYMELEARINSIPIKDVDNLAEYIDFEVNKCLFSAPDKIAEQREKELVELFSDKASIYRSEPFFIEVMPKGGDKAASLDRLVNILGMDKEDTICCGDGFNDLSMIKYAGVGVAMANAQEVVKTEADYVTLSNDEDGLIPVIEKFILSDD